MVVFNTIQDLMYYIVLTVSFKVVSFVVVPGHKNEEIFTFWGKLNILVTCAFLVILLVLEKCIDTEKNWSETIYYLGELLWNVLFWNHAYVHFHIQVHGYVHVLIHYQTSLCLEEDYCMDQCHS